MAGLLDFGSNPYAGLLSEEDLAGARRQATTDALLKLSAGLFQAGAPSRTPQSLGAALVGGLQGVGAGYQGTLQQAAQQKLMQQKLQADLQSKQRAAKAQELMPNLFTEATPYQPAPYLAGAPYGKAIQAKSAGLDQDIQKQLMALGPEGQKAFMDALAMRKATQGETLTVAPESTVVRVGFDGQPEVLATGAPKTPDLQRQFNFAKTPEGGGYTGTFEQFKAISAPKTTNIVNPLQPDKKTAGDLQAILLNAGDRRMRYNQINATLDPKFLTVPYRTEQAWTSLKEKFVELPEEQKAELQRFSSWKQNAVNNLSLTIKELTGAAMGVEEAKRIIAGLPNPGSGLTDGDSPTEFKAKLDQTMQQMKLVEARATYLLKNGLTLDKVSLDSMPQIINQRGKQIATQYKLDPSKPSDLDLIKKQLSAEFGISTQ